MSYKDLVKKIADLDWAKASPGDIILLSRGTAVEFADSLRVATHLYPKDERLAEMVQGELKTDNMRFEDYKKKGDHWEFLDYFIHKLQIVASKDGLALAIKKYSDVVENFSDTDRAMTVFSREEELTLIFKKILQAHDWDGLGFGFYRHYLESHILFDSGAKGHHYLTQHFPIHEHEDVLERFYKIRLNLYSVLF